MKGQIQGVEFADCLNFQAASGGLFQWNATGSSVRTTRKGMKTFESTHLKVW